MKRLIYTIAGIALIATSCEHIEEGYMSDNVYYIENPYTVEQGSTVNSAALELDMSTTPVKVQLLDIRSVVTGMTEEAWYGNSLVTYWNDVPSIVSDTTLELLKAKYTEKEYPIFKINEIGGRMEFSRGTKNVPLGEYEIDIVASNMRETRYIYNACNIILTEPTTFISPTSMDGGAQEIVSGTDNLSNFGLFRTGAKSDPYWAAPFAHYDFMDSLTMKHISHCLDSVIAQYPDGINFDDYMEVVDEPTAVSVESVNPQYAGKHVSYKTNLSWVVVKFTDAARAPFKWHRNHNESYKVKASYDNITDINGNPVLSEIRPIFDGDKIDETYKPFEHYSPWLIPIYGGDYLISPYPVSPYPPTNIKEDMTYCRYRIDKNALHPDINGYLVVLVNYVVDREGMYIVELQTDATFTLTPNEGLEGDNNKEYSGQIFRSQI